MKLLRVLILSIGITAIGLSGASAQKVSLTEDAETYTMDNGIVKVRISKVSGDLVSFRYNDSEMFATTLSPDFVPQAQSEAPVENPNWKNPSIGGRAHGYWSHDAMGVKGSAPAVPSITIHPAKNGGQIAEVSVKAIGEGRKLGTGPGTPPDGNLTLDIEIRYTLEKGSPGVYTCCIFTHKAEYPLGMFGEARYCAKLAPFFDWISVDADVNHHYPKDMFVGDKYVYTANQTDNPAFGWLSTTKKVGLFFINPSMEYMGGGPTKVEFLGHRDTNQEAAPCVLNYWRSSHYGGAEANIAEGEKWEKIIGPFFIYANSGINPESIYADARARATLEASKWPYSWVAGVDYPQKQERATVSGKLKLTEPLKTFANLHVGLTAGEYLSPRPDSSRIMTGWQRDAKFYQFWAKGNADGSFEIKNVRPGVYTLSAFTDGVLGELCTAGIVVKTGENLRLGDVEWKPARRGRQIWEIGIPNRTPAEFFMSDQRRDPAVSLKYAELFPNDITYTIGKSNYSKDWFFQHVPHNTDPDAQPQPFYGIRAIGKATPYTVVFDMPQVPAGKAYLQLAICGTGARKIDVEVNGKPAGTVDKLSGDGVITRHGSSGIWYQREIEVDAALLQKGVNTLTLTVPEGQINNGMVYDYIRFEVSQ